MASAYNFLWRQQGLLHPLDLVRSSMFIQPPGVFNASLGWNTDVYSQRPLRSLGYNLGLNLQSGGAKRASSAPDLPVEQTARLEPSFEENWSLGLAYSYAGGYQTGPSWSSSKTANAVLRYQFSPAWGLEYSGSYDVTLREVQVQRFALTRDLHCWQASFTRTFSQGGEAEYYFRLGIKDQKEIYLERGTRESSFGGIR
jgi:hypothetical protein